MKNYQESEINEPAGQRASEFMKIYGLALLFFMAVSFLVNIHPAFSGHHVASEGQREVQEEKTSNLAAPLAKVASHLLGGEAGAEGLQLP